MDPHRNPALSDAKLQTILQTLIHSTPQPNAATAEDMPAPPSYHSVVNPMAPIPNMHSPYDPEEEDDEEDKDDDDETPDITVNAATQIRGNGHIISITQMDSVRIAGLIGMMLYGPQPAQASARAPAPKSAKHFPKFNITVNCGATVIGDRNIVGPGLGDIARQMQASQRNQALQAQAKGTAATVTAPLCSQVPTPPLSPNSSAESGGAKRKAEDEGRASAVKKQC
jgi:hypothetical protein